MTVEPPVDVLVRGVARRWNVAVVQFIKSDKWVVGEEEIGRRLEMVDRKHAYDRGIEARRGLDL